MMDGCDLTAIMILPAIDGASSVSHQWNERNMVVPSQDMVLYHILGIKLILQQKLF